MRLTRRILATCAALYLSVQVLFLINIQFPRGHNFDEFHYVPSATQYLEMKENQNWEHPPLGKLFMAVGIAIWGDIPIGWRFMSTVFGALTLVGMYLWGYALFESEQAALWIALVTLFNQLLYVQSRIGMLDTFMMGFVTWALVAFTRSWKPGLSPRRTRRLMMFTGAMLGLATACKWFAVIPWVACLGLVMLVRLFQSWKTSFPDARSDDWYHPDLWKGLRLRDWLLSFVAIPMVLYCLTFVPLYIIQKPPIGFWDLFDMQKKMWEGQLRVVTNHPYMSTWKDWPLLGRPIWYAFDKEGSNQEWVRGVLLLGNPLVMWVGLLALLYCVWGWVRTRSREAFLILAFYGVFFGSWVMIPRRIAFYYYYYPAGMVLSLALAYFFFRTGEPERAAPSPMKGPGGGKPKGVAAPGVEELLAAEALDQRILAWSRWVFLGATIALFFYFLPILAALRIPSDSFRKWMWFRSWI